MHKFIISILFLSTIAMAKVPAIKVRIAESQKQVKISGMDLTRKLWVQKTEKIYPARKTILFNCYSQESFEKNRKPLRLATLSSKTKMMTLGKEKYKGKLHIQTSDGSNACDVVNEVSLEDYLSTLLAKEMHAKWPIEALKAQAVAARSYAYFKMQTKQVAKTKGYEVYYDLENSEKHQVNGNFFDATVSTRKAARQTQGEILVFENKPLPIFFHSKCGGKTRLPEQVWSNKVPGYTSVACPFCHEHGKKNWKNNVDGKKMYSSLRKILKTYQNDYNSRKQIKILNDHLNSSKIKFYMGEDFKVIKKSRLRSVMGRKNLPSNYFLLTSYNDEFKMIGSGYGHGVGMCQFGAKELALQGYTYRQILSHYFPMLKLKKIY